MNLLESVLLGLVQGLTEFLPVSSSGHLVLAEEILKINPEENIRFVVVVHLATLLAVIAFFRVEVVKIMKGIFFGRVRIRKGRVRFPDEYTRLAWLLVLATIPAVIIGLIWADKITELFYSSVSVGIFLIITGGLLMLVRFVHPPRGNLNWWKSLIIGIFQSLAMLPGISRSGSTISAGIYCGVNKEKAAEFSFLLSIPVILGAGVMEARKAVISGISFSELAILGAGALTAAVSGYLAIRFLLRVIRRGKLHYFAYYCWLIGLLVIFLS